MRRSMVAALAFFFTVPAWSDPTPAAHQAAFERFKKLEGTWIGSSTRGWKEEKSYRVIAGGSVVMGTSFDAHPGETMATMFHLDRGKLMLTHYCVAKNQPRLVASEISEDGKTIIFTFLDGTGLASRDQGHMDKAVYRFIDDDHVEAQWTWYQNGKERWLENIVAERVQSPKKP
jgi:hypothetical protein